MWLRRRLRCWVWAGALPRPRVGPTNLWRPLYSPLRPASFQAMALRLSLLFPRLQLRAVQAWSRLCPLPNAPHAVRILGEGDAQGRSGEKCAGGFSKRFCCSLARIITMQAKIKQCQGRSCENRSQNHDKTKGGAWRTGSWGGGDTRRFRPLQGALKVPPGEARPEQERQARPLFPVRRWACKGLA